MESKYEKITARDRQRIEELVGEGASCKAIAEELGKDSTSISREVKRNRIDKPAVSKSKFRRNPCAKRESCTKRGLCSRRGCKRLCAKCEALFCHDRCRDFLPWSCERVGRWPYVCNRCRHYATCPQQRFVYLAKRAQGISEFRASTSRKGIHADLAQLENAHEIVLPLLERGQSPYHIWVHHRCELGFSLTTFYAYVNAGLFGSSRMRLPRAVRFKTRKKKSALKDKRDFTGRTFDDYLMGMEAFHEEV